MTGAYGVIDKGAIWLVDIGVIQQGCDITGGYWGYKYGRDMIGGYSVIIYTATRVRSGWWILGLYILGAIWLDIGLLYTRMTSVR